VSSVGEGGSSGILVLHVEIDKYHTRPNLDVEITSPLRYYAAPLTSLWFLAAKQPPAEFCRIDLGGRKRDLRRRFFGLRGTIHRIHNILSIYFGDIDRILDIFSTKAMGHTTSAPRVSIQLVSDDLI
jgi:hypothetical protein